MSQASSHESGDEETIRLLRKDNARLRQLLAAAEEKLAALPHPAISFPVETPQVGRWQKIKSTSELRPGLLIRLLDDPKADHLILAKEGKTLWMQSLQDGSVGTLSVFSVKANWKLNSRARLPKLLKAWRISQA